jgi:hypothetical protein
MTPKLIGVALATGLMTATFAETANALTPDGAKAIAEEAYIYGCSLVSVGMSRKVITNVEKPRPTPTARSTSISRRTTPARTKNRTGCLLRTAPSFRCSVYTGRRRILRPYWTARGGRRSSGRVELN